MAKFIVFYEGKPLNTYMIDEPVITIGRLPENTISIANMGISRRHLRIEEDYDRKYILTDLNSLNSTFVNGKRIKKVPLHSGDKITIGKFTIIYEETDPQSGHDQAMNQSSPAPDKALPPANKSGTKSMPRPGISSDPAETPALAPRHPTQKMPIIAEAEEDKQPTLIETTKHLTYVIDKPYMTIGNGESDDIPISGFMVSEQQASIEQSEDGWKITTNKLMAKMKINGKPAKSHVLKHKDRIDMGSLSFRFMENG